MLYSRNSNKLVLSIFFWKLKKASKSNKVQNERLSRTSSSPQYSAVFITMLISIFYSNLCFANTAQSGQCDNFPCIQLTMKLTQHLLAPYEKRIAMVGYIPKRKRIKKGSSQ